MWLGAYLVQQKYEPVLLETAFKISEHRARNVEYLLRAQAAEEKAELLAAQITKLENDPPKVIAVEKILTVEVIKEVIVTVEVTKEVKVPFEVMKQVKVPYNPIPFQSGQELRNWVGTWKPRIVAWGSLVMDSACEGIAYAMIIDMVNDGYLAGAQIDPYHNHMLVAVPIYTENRYLFVDPATKVVTTIFCGREWRIN